MDRTSPQVSKTCVLYKVTQATILGVSTAVLVKASLGYAIGRSRPFRQEGPRFAPSSYRGIWKLVLSRLMDCDVVRTRAGN